MANAVITTGTAPTEAQLKEAIAWLKFAPCRSSLLRLARQGGGHAQCGMGGRERGFVRALTALRDRGMVEHDAAGAHWQLTKLGLAALNGTRR
ncbi:MAG: hypothetical protein VYA51_12765 [Planctomycetota bacterium]|nr:hypothetical protein [Planctomycetota bacterium]